MELNKEVNREKIEHNQPETVANALQNLVRENLVSEARRVFIESSKVQKTGTGVALLYTDILLNAGHLTEAERVLEAELQKNEQSYPLLYRLGRLDEMRQQHLNAFDLFRQAEPLAETAAQKKEVRQALDRVKENIDSEVFFKPDAYMVKLKGNNRPLNLRYNLPQLSKRKALLDALLDNIDYRAKSVLEIECDGGIIARNLAAHGLKAEGVASDVADLTLAIGFEYIEMLREAGFAAPEYYRFEASKTSVKSLERFDVITLLPPRLGWYRSKGLEEAARVIGALFKLSKKQLFFLIPAGEKGFREREFERLLLEELSGLSVLPVKPELCFEVENTGALYRVDRGKVKTGREKLLPEGLNVLGSRSHIFEVELARCRSLNGFSYGPGGWNHFSAVLEEMTEAPQFSYKGSILDKFYGRFQPKTRGEQLFGASTEEDPLGRGWTLLPWVETKNRFENPAASPVSRSGGNPHYGPNNRKFGENECRRLMANYTLINEYGYQPEIFPDGYIQGYFLKDGKDYRFYINEGQHRAAVVGMLGYEKIKAKFNPEFAPVVDLKNIKDWPQVRRCLYSKEQAEKVFRYYFEEDGRRKAKELGLI